MSSVLPLLLALVVASGCAGQPLDESVDPSNGETPLVMGVYALSRGAGVPDEAREALRTIADLVAGDETKGISVRSERTRIGIEGETRLCIVYRDPDAARAAHRRIQEIVEGVDLLNLVAEDCMKKPEAG